MGKANGYIKTVKKIIEVIEASENKQLSTKEIHDWLASNWNRYAPTNMRLVNILSKSKNFEAIGEVPVYGNLSTYKVKVWGVRYEASIDN